MENSQTQASAPAPAPKASAPTPKTTVKKAKSGNKLDDLLSKVRSEEVEQVDEKLNLKKAEMGEVIKDFYKSKAPQFKGRSKAKPVSYTHLTLPTNREV